MSRRVLGAALACAATLGACSTPAAPPAAGDRVAADPRATLRTIPLTVIGTDGRSHRFVVEVAETSDEQSRGLMERPPLAPNAGMLFPMVPPRMASFWMKDTPSALDIIFIRPDGVIARIAEQATPLSLDPIDSGVPVGAVLEIGAGRSAALGITPGARVKWAER